jgi:hypothetical protein
MKYVKSSQTAIVEEAGAHIIPARDIPQTCVDCGEKCSKSERAICLSELEKPEYTLP